jgi:hypothetical protein
MRLEGEHDVPGESIQVQVQRVQITQVPKNGQPSSFTNYFSCNMSPNLLSGTKYPINKDHKCTENCSVRLKGQNIISKI